VLLFVPDEVAKAYEEAINTIQDEAERHGVGLVVAARADDYAQWDARVEPKRHEPSPEKLNDFIDANKCPFQRDDREVVPVAQKQPPANFGVKLSAGWCPARQPSCLPHRQFHGVTPAASLLAREARRSLHQGR